MSLVCASLQRQGFKNSKKIKKKKKPLPIQPDIFIFGTPFLSLGQQRLDAYFSSLNPGSFKPDNEQKEPLLSISSLGHLCDVHRMTCVGSRSCASCCWMNRLWGHILWAPVCAGFRESPKFLTHLTWCFSDFNSRAVWFLESRSWKRHRKEELLCVRDVWRGTENSSWRWEARNRFQICL